MMNAEKIDMHKLALLGESEQFQESGESMFDSIKQQTIAIQRLRVAVVVTQAPIIHLFLALPAKKWHKSEDSRLHICTSYISAMNYNMTYQTTDIRADKSRNIFRGTTKKTFISCHTVCMHTHTLLLERIRVNAFTVGNLLKRKKDGYFN